MFKSDFPLLQNKQVVYLDTAASSQKPGCVLSAMSRVYETTYANVHRGQCEIATAATTLYEHARKTVADFLGTQPKQIIFTKGATEGINLVASGYEHLLSTGDEVLISVSEHHANFVPWQQICRRTGATFKVFSVLPDGRLDLDDFKLKLSPKTKIVAVTQLSNVLGIVNPISEIIQLAHSVGAKVLIDGAQGVAHLPTNVSDLGCDFYAFSGHKIYGPTGIGVLYGTEDALNLLEPYQFGGDMIKTVSVERTVFADIPAKFEAGTPPFVEAVGLAAAIDYVSKIGMDKIEQHERELTSYCLEKLSAVKNCEILGTYPEKQGLISFNITGVHPSDISFVLSKENICVRVGHHCAMPIHHHFKKEVSLRVSFGLYNDKSDVDYFIKSLQKGLSLLGGIMSDEILTPPVSDMPDMDLAFKATAGEPLPAGTPPASKDDIIAGLKAVQDPELMLNVYELGLIYDIKQQENGDVYILMTLTSPTCPMAGEMPGMVANAASSVLGTGVVTVELTFDPPWTTDRLSDDIKLMMGI